MFENLSEKLEKAFKILKGQGSISEINVAQKMKEIRKALLAADVDFRTAKSFTTKVKEKAMGQKVLSAVEPGQLLTKIMQDELAQLMGSEQSDINLTGSPAVILYGDNISSAMQYLINETEKRRKIQKKFNIKNNIKPKTIFKTHDEIKNATIVAANEEIIKEIEIDFNSNDLDEIELKDLIKKIRRRMLNYAKELKFEEASIMRDKLQELESKVLNGK